MVVEKLNGRGETEWEVTRCGQIGERDTGRYGYPWPLSMAGGIIIGIIIITHHSPIGTNSHQRGSSLV
jgi:hypothetical protein